MWKESESRLFLKNSFQQSIRALLIFSAGAYRLLRREKYIIFQYFLFGFYVTYIESASQSNWLKATCQKEFNREAWRVNSEVNHVKRREREIDLSWRADVRLFWTTEQREKGVMAFEQGCGL